MLNGSVLEVVDSARYLGVTFASNITDWKLHCGRVLKRARAVFFKFRIFYSKFAPKFVELLVYKNVVRPVLEYCADIVLPNAYFSAQFERVQKFAVRSYCRDFDTEYSLILSSCNLVPLSSRRAAAAVVNLHKYILQCHFFVPGFFCFGFDLGRRRSARRNTADDVILIRNFPTDGQITTFPRFSPSFKKSFLFRAITNFNHFRRVFDLDSFTFKQLRLVISLFDFDCSGIVIP